MGYGGESPGLTFEPNRPILFGHKEFRGSATLRVRCVVRSPGGDLRLSRAQGALRSLAQVDRDDSWVRPYNERGQGVRFDRQWLVVPLIALSFLPGTRAGGVGDLSDAGAKAILAAHIKALGDVSGLFIGEVHVEGSKGFRTPKGYINTLHEGSVRRVISSPAKYRVGIHNFAFVSEGGRIESDLEVSSRSVALERNVDYILVLPDSKRFGQPFLRERNLVGRVEDGSYYFPTLDLRVPRSTFDATVLDLVGEDLTRDKSWGDSFAVLDVEIKRGTKRSSEWTIHGSEAKVLSVLGGSVLVDLPAGSLINIDLPDPMYSDPIDNIVVFGVPTGDHWKLADCDYPIWQFVDGLYYPLTLRGPDQSPVRRMPGFTLEKLRTLVSKG